MTRLPKTAHTSRPWRVHDVAGDFKVEDVWALPTPGGPDDFPRLLEWFTTDDRDPSEASPVRRALFAIRWKLGELFGLDDERSGIKARVPSVRDRLPEDLRDGPRGTDPEGVPFTSVYLTEDEWVAEMANKTCHAMMHLGWVKDGEGYRGQMAVLVKANGLAGRLYMAGIMPFRHLLVYPALMREIDKAWRKKMSVTA